MLIRLFLNPNPKLEAQLNTIIIVLGYIGIVALTRVLKDNTIYTVISAVSMLNLVVMARRSLSLSAQSMR